MQTSVMCRAQEIYDWLSQRNKHLLCLDVQRWDNLSMTLNEGVIFNLMRKLKHVILVKAEMRPVSRTYLVLVKSFNFFGFNALT